ncbi:MAG: DMT family transporter [Roseivirga sp.]|nr:DMT family transporter [Roseivirga sp.]
MSKSTKTIAVFLGVLGVVLFSAKAVMVKMAYQYDIPPVPLLLLRMLFALPFYATMAFLRKPAHPEKIVKKDYLWIVFFGMMGYFIASYFDFLGLQYIQASLERIILFLYPTIVLFMSRIFLKQRITRLQILAILISYLGIIITFWGAVAIEGSDVVLGGLLVFVSALTYAGYLVGSGWLIPRFGSVTFTSYAMIVSCLSICVYYGLTQDVSNLWQYPTEVYGIALAMAVLSTVIPSYLISESIKGLGAPNFSIIGSLGPVSTIILANIFLDERLSALQVVGTVVVIVGIYVVSRKK